uniref:hypothetical protein n=1 Tax=uncultured Draconibacterium sp. TaxID=1573823 RepID=UPI0032176A98
MKRHLNKLVAIFSLIYLFGCEANKIQTEYSINGNWCTLIDSVYNEICFRGDTLERFNLEWDFLPPSVYKVDNDSLRIKSTLNNSTITKYKITFIDSDNAVFEGLNEKLVLKKIPDDEYTIDDLINQGFFNYRFGSPVPDSLKNNFVDSIFKVREVKYLIENNILNKDTLIEYWNSQILKDNADKEYYKFLIKEINKNLP